MTFPESGPPDDYHLDELRVYIEAIRGQGGDVRQLDEAPLDYPGVDDTNNRFTWYELVMPGQDAANPAALARVGVFHLPKGVEL